MSPRKKDGRLVWSSDGPAEDNSRETTPAAAPTDGVVRVARQTKGRKGRGVTVITGIPLAGDDLKDLAKSLKQRCGSGGTVKNGVVEIQGDHRDTVVSALSSKGWTVKKAGG